jgi:hypothetical protein
MRRRSSFMVRLIQRASSRRRSVSWTARSNHADVIRGAQKLTRSHAWVHPECSRSGPFSDDGARPLMLTMAAQTCQRTHFCKQ